MRRILYFEEHARCLIKTLFFKAPQKNVTTSSQCAARAARQLSLSLITESNSHTWQIMPSRITVEYFIYKGAKVSLLIRNPNKQHKNTIPQSS